MDAKQVMVKQISNALPHGATKKIWEKMQADGIQVTYAKVAAVFRRYAYDAQVVEYGAAYLREFEKENAAIVAKTKKKLKGIIPA